MNADGIVNYLQEYLETNVELESPRETNEKGMSLSWIFGQKVSKPAITEPSIFDEIKLILEDSMSNDEKVQCIAPLLQVKENMKTEDVSCLIKLHQAFFIHYCSKTDEDMVQVALSHDSYPSSFLDNQEAVKSQFKAKFYSLPREGVESLPLKQRQALKSKLTVAQSFQNCTISILFQASDLTPREAIGQSSSLLKKDIESALKECKVLELEARARAWTNRLHKNDNNICPTASLNNNPKSQPKVAQYS